MKRKREVEDDVCARAQKLVWPKKRGDRWSFYDRWLKEEGPFRHHTDSFHELITWTLPKILETEEPVTSTVEDENGLRHRMTIIDFHVGFPAEDYRMQTPSKARHSDASYTLPLFVTCKLDKINASGEVVETTQHKSNIMGKMPAMKGSFMCCTTHPPEGSAVEMNECLYDASGYFLINASEKMIKSHEEAVHNRPIVVQKKPNQREVFVAQITSNHKSALRSPSVLYIRALQKGKRKACPWIIKVTPPYVKFDVPVVIMLHALGCTTAKDIADAISAPFERTSLVNAVLENCFDDGAHMISAFSEDTVVVARKLIAKKIKPNTPDDQLQTVFLNTILNDAVPHTGPFLEKKLSLIESVCHKLLLTVTGACHPDDRDQLDNKRLCVAGTLIGELFTSQIICRIRNDVKQDMNRAIAASREWSVSSIPNNSPVFRGLKYALASGQWTAGKTNNRAHIRFGVSEVLNRMSSSSILSQGRRSASTMQRDGKQTWARETHAQHLGRYCFLETPEGAGVGLVHHLAHGVIVSVESNILPLMTPEFLGESFVLLSTQPRRGRDLMGDTFMVQLNGTPIGTVSDPSGVAKKLRNMRKHLVIPRDVGITINPRWRLLVLQTDRGRLCAPFARVDPETGRVPLWETCEETASWTMSELVSAGLVEFIDPEEQETCIIASGPENFGPDYDHVLQPFTHAQIHNSSILSLNTGLIPFPECNAAARNSFQNAMGKQAMSVPVFNFNDRSDTTLNFLDYPQRCIASTRTIEATTIRDLPAGQMVNICIMPDGDHTVEDAIMIKKEAVDRGLFRSSTLRGVSVRESKDSEQFCVPGEECSEIKRSNKSHLDLVGMPEIGTLLTTNDAIVGKSTSLSSSRRSGIEQRRDVSVDARPGRVDRVMVGTKLAGGDRVAKVVTREICIPQVGDKYATQHGMKGVCSVLFKEIDAPFNEHGITPDAIFNSHGKPSRMSWGELYEILTTSLGIEIGSLIDSTAFEQMGKEDYVDTVKGFLKELGVDPNCMHTLYDGRTGRCLGRCFMGMVMVQRLKHLVENKIHSRSRGAKQALTQQPVEGRGKGGGFKQGNMEKDALIGHGAARFIRDRLHENSDRYMVPICGDCGVIAINHKNQDLSWCSLCNSRNIKIAEMPYSAKLVIQELMAINVVMKLQLDDL
jgi:DNA-directed RNA polymerase II subunit RPB2